MSTHEALQIAHQQLEEENVPEAFSALLRAWRSLRAKEIAELVDALSERASRSFVISAEAQTQAERLVAWSDAFRDCSPLGLGPVLADLDKFVTDSAFVRTGVNLRLVFPRVDSLATFVHDDPRVTRPLFRALPILNGGVAWKKVLIRCFRVIETAGDPRAIEALAALTGDRPAVKRESYHLQNFIAERGPDLLATLRSRFPDGVPPLPADLVALVASIKSRIESLATPIAFEQHITKSSRAGDPDALLQAVYDSPDDDEVRMVYADALAERGDPRGEFIVLQLRRLQGESTDKTRAREEQLLKKHRRAWLGPIAAIVPLNTAIFERGFLERCEARPKNAALADVHLAHPVWATVRSLHFHIENTRITPAMRSLREVGPVDLPGFRQLCAMGGHPKIERLDITVPGFIEDGELVTPEARAFATTVSLPALRHLSLFVRGYRTDYDLRLLRRSDFDWLWDAPWAGQLITLGVPCTQDMPAWIEVLTTRKHLDEIALGGHRETAIALLRRTPDRTGVELVLRNNMAHWSGTHSEIATRFMDLLERFQPNPILHSLAIEPLDVIIGNNQRVELRNAARRFRFREIKVPWESKPGA